MSNVNRRHFLGAAAVASVAAPLALAADKKRVPASEKLVVALVGCGGMGRGDLADFMKQPEVEVAAVCDVDSKHIADAMGDIRKANRPVEKVQGEKDFRRVVERKDIDA